MNKFLKILFAILAVVAVSIIGFGAYFLIGGDRSEETIKKENANSFEFKSVSESSKAVISEKSSSEKQVVAESKAPPVSAPQAPSTTMPPPVETAPEGTYDVVPEISEPVVETPDLTSDIEALKAQYAGYDIIIVNPDGTESQVQ
ncbi:hypothetical protein RyT2_07910 [Pseudolactococcus yaeyamensis]